MTARTANGLGFLACAALLAYAYYAQYVMHLEPCPLCIFQRVGIFALGVIFAVAALHDPVGWGRRTYAGLVLLAALDFMLKVFPLTDVLVKVLTGSGECAKVTWRFLGLAMPAWVLIAAVALAAHGLWANLQRRRPVLRF
jgi:disulfide bond formation protein DsbB